MASATRSGTGSPTQPVRPGRRRVYLISVAAVVIGAYMAFVLVNTQLVGHETRVPFLGSLYLQDGLDILAATVLVLLATLALDRLLARDERRVVLEQVVEPQRRLKDALMARVAVETVREVLSTFSEPIEVSFCCFSPAALAIYEGLLAER